MSITTPYTRFFDLRAVGRFGFPYAYGEGIYARSRYGREESKIDNNRDVPISRFGIYKQRTIGGKRKILKCRNYWPKNPRTAPQQTWRGVFADGMTAWAGLTEAERQAYHTEAQKYHLHGVNLYLRRYLKSNI